MLSKQWWQLSPSALKILFQIGAVFMVGEAVFHFSGIRLVGTESVWPASAVGYLYFFQALWASASAFIALCLWFIANQLNQVKQLLTPLGLFMIFHGCLLFYFAGIGIGNLAPVPALHLWHPYYDWQLVLEGSLLILAGLGIILRQTGN